jgi:RNA polymerase sigma factor (sigma-70 family)
MHEASAKDANKKLWTLFISGDSEALNLLYKQFIDSLYAFGLRYTQDADLVKDAIQDLFIDLHKYRKTLTADVNVKAYLFSSLRRKVYLLLKKKAAEEHHNFEMSFQLSTFNEQENDADDHQSETLIKLQKHLELLPGRQKEALYLRFNSELEYEEIAAIMDISIGTCRTLVYRGVKQLREKMVIQHAIKHPVTPPEYSLKIIY